MSHENLPHLVQVIVKLATPTPTGGRLREHLGYFRFRLDKQNVQSQSSVVNRRHIELVLDETDAPEEIRLNIYSEAPIEVPGRAMTGFSRSLLTPPEKLPEDEAEHYDPFFKQNVFHGKLFTFQTVLEHEKNDQHLPNNEEMLHSLLKISFLPQSTLTVTQQRALKQIKTILVNSGIYCKTDTTTTTEEET